MLVQNTPKKGQRDKSIGLAHIKPWVTPKTKTKTKHQHMANTYNPSTCWKAAAVGLWLWVQRPAWAIYKPEAKGKVKKWNKSPCIKDRGQTNKAGGTKQVTSLQHTQNTLKAGRQQGLGFSSPPEKIGTVKIVNILSQVQDVPELSKSHGAKLLKADFCPCLD